MTAIFTTIQCPVTVINSTTTKDKNTFSNLSKYFIPFINIHQYQAQELLQVKRLLNEECNIKRRSRNWAVKFMRMLKIGSAFQTFLEFFRGDIYQFKKKYKTLIFFTVETSDFTVIFVVLQPLHKGPMNIIQSEGIQDLCHSLFHLFNIFRKTTPQVLFQLEEQPKVIEAKFWTANRVMNSFNAYICQRKTLLHNKLPNCLQVPIVFCKLVRCGKQCFLECV